MSQINAVTRKVCHVCGSDLAGKKRVKDDAGRYFCAACFRTKMQRHELESAAARETISDSTDSTPSSGSESQTGKPKSALSMALNPQSRKAVRAKGLAGILTLSGMIVGFFVVAIGVVIVLDSMGIESSNVIVFAAFAAGLSWIGLLAYFNDKRLGLISGVSVIGYITCFVAILTLPLIVMIGVKSLWGTGAIAIVCVPVILMNWYFASRTCPSCGRCDAKVLGEEDLGTSVNYKTVTRTDYIKDTNSVVPIGTINRREQVAVEVRRVQTRFQCAACGHTWTKESRR